MTSTVATLTFKLDTDCPSYIPVNFSRLRVASELFAYEQVRIILHYLMKQGV